MKHHLVIAGPGRCGTTFLVRYLTECGLETHLSRNPDAKLDTHAHAGLEEALWIGGADLPYVAKSPWLFEFVDRLVNRDDVRIDAVIIPMRNIVEAAASRVTIELRDRLERSGFDEERTQWETWGAVRGGVVYSLAPLDQARILAMGFYRTVHACVGRDIPVVLLDFPRLVDDAEYLYQQLAPVIGKFVERNPALEAHKRIASHELVRVGKELAQGAESDFPTFAALDRAALFREVRRLLAEKEESELIRQSHDLLIKRTKEETELIRQSHDLLIKRTQELESSLRAVISSRTWRITYPFRFAISALTGRL